jgi:hypothetical protein
LALRSREGRKLLVPCALLLAVYFGNIGTRFLIPSLAFISLAMALALEAAVPVLALLIVFHAVSSLPSVVAKYTTAWALHDVPYKAALRIIPEEQFLGSFPEYQWARIVERNVPRGKIVYTFSGLADAYTTREVLVSYWGGLNNDMSDTLSTGWIKLWQPEKVLIFFLPDSKYRRLRVVQTGTGTFREEQWSIHEIRFLHEGKELPRRPEWRLRASPNPWGVQMAFDNSEATRWKGWETLRPGMWIETDFGREEAIDQLHVELSGDEADARMHVETQREGGRWTPLAARSEERKVKYSGSIRRAATYEAHLRGIDYVFVKDDDWGAKEYAGSPESWGMTLLEHAFGASLYKVNP